MEASNFSLDWETRVEQLFEILERNNGINPHIRKRLVDNMATGLQIKGRPKTFRIKQNHYPRSYKQTKKLQSFTTKNQQSRAIIDL